MTYIVVQSNITAVLSWVVFVGLGVLMCLEGFSSALYASIARKISYEKFRNEECGWLFWISWLLSCFLFSLLGALFVWDMYTISYQSDSAPIIFGALLFYVLAMRGWIWSYYTMRWTPVASYTLSVFAFFSAVLVIGVAFMSIDDHPWHHYFSLVLLVPPVTACFSIYQCEKCDSRATLAVINRRPDERTFTPSPPPQNNNSIIANNNSLVVNNNSNNNNFSSRQPQDLSRSWGFPASQQQQQQQQYPPSQFQLDIQHEDLFRD